LGCLLFSHEGESKLNDMQFNALLLDHLPEAIWNLRVGDNDVVVIELTDFGKAVAAEFAAVCNQNAFVGMAQHQLLQGGIFTIV